MPFGPVLRTWRPLWQRASTARADLSTVSRRCTTKSSRLLPTLLSAECRLFHAVPPLAGNGRGSCHLGLRLVTTTSINFQDISFEDLEALINGGDIQLIDVREPSEIKSSGKIGQAINIPLGQVKAALLLSEEGFREKYHAEKPHSYDHNIVFYWPGPHPRANAALELAKKDRSTTLAREYSGGWEDVLQQEKTL
uniref:Putative secreted salivary gland peptide n=1 Tax=Ixodes ricinus TaxID=34613 RepID=A0A090XBE5_IXORI